MKAARLGSGCGATVEQPRAPREYPEKWRIWEEELMAPILSSHPDAIKFTTYEELGSGA
jgi:hypothetical protein